MPRELVTKAGRFYCVSLTPDICKTPVGSATPPIPYMIKGEFSQATNVSKNVRSNGEQVVIHASTVVPSVTGDEPGTAKGIKSGTTGKRVQHDQKSSTVSINGERAIREGDTVFMNDKNTKGKVLERGGGGSASAITKQVSVALNTAEQSLGKAKAWVDSTTEIKEIARMKEQYRNKFHETHEAQRPFYDLAGMSDFITFQNMIVDAAIDLIPDSLLDLIPAKKGVAAAKTATKSARAVRGLNKVEKAGEKSVKSAPPSKGTNGGKSRGKGKKEKKDKPSNCCPKNAGPGGKRTSSKHPVHLGTGEEVLQQIDFALGGAIPIVWARCYRSGSETEDWSILGARWASPYTAHLSISRKGIVYHDDTGRSLRLPLLDPGQEFDHRGEGFVLARTDDQAFTLTWRDGSRDRFTRDGTRWLPHGYEGVNAMLPPEPAELCERFSLCRSEDAAGRGLDIDRFHASGEPVLLRVRTDDGRVVEAMRRPRARNVETDLISHVDEVRPDGQRVCHVRYDFVAVPDDSSAPLPRRHNLVNQTDRSGATRHYRYSAHLLTAYTAYGGFEHRLEWISLAALRQRWDGSPLPDGALAELHPITADNSYQARATATRTADGRDEVTIDYLDEDTTRVTEPCGNVFDYTFDENWLALNVALVPPDGAPPRTLGTRVWDRDGMLLEETDALFRTWRYCYDQSGNLVANTNAEGSTTRLDYDEHNRPIRITDPLGNATAYEYDASGNLACVTNALGHSTRFEYDAQGRMIAQVDAKGGRTLYSYDAAGRLRSHADCSGYRSYYRYDADDNLTTTLDALEQETAYTYDVSGQVTTITQPDGTQDHYTYDAAGNLVMHTDALGYQTHYRYDGHGMPTERINALGHSVKYRYDAALRLVELINGNGERYCYSYTAEGWLATETGYDGKVTQYRYDRAGQLIAYESCGIVIQLERDRMGRLILKTTPDGLTRYQYDALGRLTAVTAPHAENGFVYNAIGQLLEEHSAYFISEPCPEAYSLRRVPDHYFVMRYAYDELGNRIQTILPDGHRIDVLRYGSGHWHGVLWNGAPMVDVERDRLHRERKRQIGPPSTNLVATRTYDLRSRIATMVLKRESRDPNALPLRERAFTYDAVGNLLSVKHGWHSHNETLGTIDFFYDRARNLLSASQPGLTEIFNYSKSGERTGLIRTGTLAGSTPKSISHLDYNSQGEVSVSLRENRHGKVNCKYRYDAFSRRIAKQSFLLDNDGNPLTLPSKSTVFIWEDDRLSIEQAGTQTKAFIYEPDTFIPLAVIESPSLGERTIAYFNCDQVGTPRELFTPEGKLLWQAEIDSWGAELYTQEKYGTSQPLRFQGQYSDHESGLYYNRYRYYDPGSGKYTSEDPLGLLGGTNVFDYPTPTKFIDPLGLSAASPLKQNSCAAVCCAIVIGETQTRVERYKSRMKSEAKNQGYSLTTINSFPGFTWDPDVWWEGGPKTEAQWKASLMQNTIFKYGDGKKLQDYGYWKRSRKSC